MENFQKIGTHPSYDASEQEQLILATKATEYQ